MRTQAELSEAWRTFGTINRPMNADQRGRWVCEFIREIVTHPLSEWAAARDSEFEFSLADQRFNAREVLLFLEHAHAILSENPQAYEKAFGREVKRAIRHFVNIEMDAAADHKLFLAIVKAREDTFS